MIIKTYELKNYRVYMGADGFKYYVGTEIHGQPRSELRFEFFRDADEHFTDLIEMPTDVSFYDGVN